MLSMSNVNISLFDIFLKRTNKKSNNYDSKLTFNVAISFFRIKKIKIFYISDLHLLQNMRSRNSLAFGYATRCLSFRARYRSKCKTFDGEMLFPSYQKRARRYISRMTRHPCLIRRTFLMCFSWVSYQWWSTAVNSAIGEYRWRSSGGCPIEFPFSGQHMPYNVRRRLLI